MLLLPVRASLSASAALPALNALDGGAFVCLLPSRLALSKLSLRLVVVRFGRSYAREEKRLPIGSN